MSKPIAYFVNLYPAASHTFIRREIKALENLGWRIHRFALRQSPDLVDAEDKMEARRTTALLPLKVIDLLGIIPLVLSRPIKTCRAMVMCMQMAVRSERGFVRSMFALPEAVILLKHLTRLRITHCHAHFGTNSTTVVRLACTLGGLSYSFTNHGPFEIDNPHALSLAEKVNDAAFVAAISDFTRAQLLRITAPKHWDRIHVVRCGLDFDDAGTPNGLLSETPELISIGRLSPEKGHQILLQAIAELVQQKVPIRMTLIGDGPLRAQLAAEIDTLGLADVVTLTGSLDGPAIEERLRRCRALVCSSFAEGLPVVLMEAFRAGRPVVATNVGGIAELVEPGVSGWLTPAGSAQRLAEAMREALNLPMEVLSEMGRAGYERARSMHDIGREAQKLSTLFEGVNRAHG